MTGPMSASGSVPFLTRTATARSSTFFTSRSAASPTATATEIAVHRWPAEPNAAAARWSDLEHAVGQPRPLEEIGQQHGCGREPAGGLEDEGVAGGDRHRSHPQRHHHGKVKRGDARDDADRLPEGEHVDPGGDLVCLAGEISPRLSAALRAAATAVFRSASLASGNLPVTWPVAGLRTGRVLLPSPVVSTPLMT